jgi:hypothetical protein
VEWGVDIQQVEGGADWESDGQGRPRGAATPLSSALQCPPTLQLPCVHGACQCVQAACFAPHAFTWRSAARNMPTLKRRRMKKAAHRSNRATTSNTVCTHEALSAHVNKWKWFRGRMRWRCPARRTPKVNRIACNCCCPRPPTPTLHSVSASCPKRDGKSFWCSRRDTAPSQSRRSASRFRLPAGFAFFLKKIKFSLKSSDKE